MNIKEAKEIDLVDYLARLGYQPNKISGHQYWYHSPFPDRKDDTPSFKVNRKMNQWYDWGGEKNARSGNIIDFGILYHSCSVGEFLQKLDGNVHAAGNPVKKHQMSNDKKDSEDEIKVIAVETLHSFPLLRYLEKRRIPLSLAQEYCREVSYQLHNKNYYAIGFPNNAGGYELRNEYIKAASSPKAVTYVDRNANENAVFEGFFNFLSYKTMYHHQQEPPRNYLILNSTSFFEGSMPFMQLYDRNYLFLDNDKTGEKFTQLALETDNEKFVDERKLYQKYDDLNDWLINIGNPPRHRLMIKH